MATILARSLHTSKNVHCSWQEIVLPQVKQCERKNFPSNEVFDFESELKKRNVIMVVILHNGASPSSTPELVSYAVLSRPKSGSSVLLHKICVSKKYRRQGIAKSILQSEIENLRKQCSKIQLWVHESNTPAMELYKSIGFGNVSEVEDYYGPGLTGIQMSLNLWQS